MFEELQQISLEMWQNFWFWCAFAMAIVTGGCLGFGYPLAAGYGAFGCLMSCVLFIVHGIAIHFLESKSDSSDDTTTTTSGGPSSST